VEICHADEAADDGDDAPEFDFFVAADAASEVVCDLAMKTHRKEACNRDGDTAEEPAPFE